MTPAQLRQHAAVRFTTVNKQDWCDAAVQALRDAADEIDRLRTEAVAADIRIANDVLVIAGLTAERDALARCKLADQDAYVAMRDQRDELRAKLAALEKQEPVDWIKLNKEADVIVRSKPTWKRFIDGTPLSNDISVWMADFAEIYAAAPVPIKRSPEMNDAVRKVLKHHGLTKVGDGVVEADLIEAVLAAAQKEQS